ncbi:MAG: NUDIX domain-containing protein [Gemmataceae bacterium]|nr:NUDIX domain-containing protein [Gemmataceae bacterium]
MSHDPGRELVDVVDEAGRTIGTVTRREMRLRGLAHRCVYILVFNRRGDLFIHLRTATKDVYPSHWDATIGGVLAAGESFDIGAVREGREELGVAIDPVALFPFQYADEASAVHAMAYQAEHDGPFQLQVEEIVRGEFAPVETVLARAKEQPFCPDSIAVLEEFRRQFPWKGQTAS